MAKPPVLQFFSNGLPHIKVHFEDTKAHIQAMYPKILELSIERAARYVDGTYYNNYTSEQPLGQLPEKITEGLYEKFNTCGIGNIAFMALYAPDPKVAFAHLQYLERIREFHFKKTGRKPLSIIR